MILMLFAFSGISVFADPISEKNYGSGDDNYSDWNDEWNTVSGKCGDSMDWVLDASDGALNISGSGQMWSRTSHGDDLWRSVDVKSVSFSGNITSIGAEAFSGAVQLTSIVLPRTVSKIGDRAFDGCTSLKSAELVNTLTSMGSKSFDGCSALTDVYFTGSKQDWLFLTDGVQTGIASGVKIHYSSTVSITAQPADVKASAGDTVKFTVKAQGNGTLKYQWYFRKKGVSNWSIWNAHTTATTSAVANDTWDGMQVYCRVEDSDNYVSSDPSVTTLLNSVVITSQPADVVTNVGDTTQFAVKAQGSGLQYQWYFRKAGVTAWTLWKGHITATTSAVANDTWDGMQVYCKISDNLGASAYSQPSTVRLNGMLKITTQPSDVVTNVGDTTQFAVKAQGSGLKYQWYFRKAGVTAWTLWKGHITATTSAVANDTWDGMQVYCKISDNLGASVNSQPSTVKLNGMPKITAQPSDVSTKVGETTKFTMKVQGSHLKYQWYFRKAGVSAWSLWNGHITATTSAISNATWNGMQVYCKITDGFGRTVSSKPCTVTITK